jgi:hypothetical protein
MVCALAKADASKADDRAAAMAEAVRLWWQVDIPVNKCRHHPPGQQCRWGFAQTGGVLG